jgi:hypothetical protein
MQEDRKLEEEWRWKLTVKRKMARETTRKRVP